MKNLFLIIFSISCTLTLIAQKGVESKINSVKLYKQNAEISRTTSTILKTGTQEIVLIGLSTSLNPSSIQISLQANHKVTLISAKYMNNYLQSNIENPEITRLKNELGLLNDQIKDIRNQKASLSGMEKILNANQSLGGEEGGFTPNELSTLLQVYKSEYLSIKKEGQVLVKEEKKLVEKKTKIQAQLTELNAKFNMPTGNIVIKVQNSKEQNVTINSSYIVRGAGWTPQYDLRSDGLDSPLNLKYKANIYQNTGLDWKNIDLTISTGNPTQNNNRPILNPLYANFRTYLNQNKDSRYLGEAETNMAYDDVDAVGRDDIRRAAKKEYGYTFNANTSENQLNVEFNISNKQSLKSDGKKNLIALKSYELENTYKYHAVPKLCNSAFLLAKVSNWGSYNLVSGPANIFFEGAFVGTTQIDASVTSDTLLVSLGKDEGISIKRVADEKFSTKKLIGQNKKESIGYNITIKNNKSKQVEIEVLDQIPVSQNSAIEVELLEKSGAKYTEKIGKLLWEINLDGGSSVNKTFNYIVKYPKNKPVTGVK